MSRNFLQAQLLQFAEIALHNEEWTAVIPAAGKGSRLGYAGPKALYPVLGRPMVSWVLDAVQPLCSRTVLVVAPADDNAIRAAMSQAHPGAPIDYCAQAEPKGTADAVWSASSKVNTPHVAVIWADQVTVQTRTVKWCMKAHRAQSGTKLTFPTALRPKPYISLVRDSSGRIIRVEQARESEITAAVAESDCGLFLFETARLFELLTGTRNERDRLGKTTGELNLLSLIPELDRIPGNCTTLRISSAEETRGVNTPDEALAAERFLEKASCQLIRPRRVRGRAR